MITSKNVIMEVHFKCFIISWKIHAFSLRYSIFYILNYPKINYETCNVMMSIIAPGRVHFGIYLLNRKSFWHTTGLSNR